MKPCSRILGSYNHSIFLYPFGRCNRQVMDNLSKSQRKIRDVHRMGGGTGRCHHRHRVVTLTRVINSNRCAFCGSGSNGDQPRDSFGNWLGRSNNRLVSVVPKVASDMKSYSTSTEAQVNDKSFEKFYIQGGMNVKPLLIERTETQEDNVETYEQKDVGRVEITDNSTVNKNDLNGSSISKLTPEREVSEVEKEAWKLLRGAVLNYCGYPVGTVAANDPADKLPLNYDQVFIRDFIPSALAFLLNGEGEIVKNFLLHTLQLQVTIAFFSLFST